MQRRVYLNMKPIPQAARDFLAAFDWTALVGQEEIPTAQALGRVTAGPVFARYSSPSYHGAAMDGYAVLAADTFGASEERPVLLTVPDQATPINTGQPLPAQRDAVIMVEKVHQAGQDQIEIRGAAFPWQHVRKVGEDIVSREMILPHHHPLSPADQAALLMAGVFRLPVLGMPRVCIIPTGGELISWQEAEAHPPAPGQIIEANSTFLAGLVSQAGGLPRVEARRPDDPQAIREAMQEALASDAAMVVVNAGTSAGSKDFLVHVLEELGQVFTHGIMAMPGKPTLLGQARGKPVVGAPGYPISAWVCFEHFMAPALALMQGQAPPERPTLAVIPARPLASKLGQEELVRVHLGRVGSQVVATPLKRGAGAITSLTRADGVVRIPLDSDGVDQGQEIQAELLGPASAVERTLVVVGSHDVALDLLADHMRRRDPRLQVSSTHLGSMAGLMAIKQGRCHLGGTHLLDPDSGEYNVSYLKRYLAGTSVRLVTMALRSQGLMVPKGNPKGITGFADLARPGVRMVNRQAGSGTRVLLDYHLASQGLDPAAIAGYDNEEYTHMGVAVTVLSGGADVGLGILAAAQALELDFIPLMQERYDLCIPLAHVEDPRVRIMLETLGDPEFQRAVAELGGYDVTPMGQVAWEG